MMGKTFQYCPVCASELVEKHLEVEDRVRRVCTSCDFVHYANPTPAAGVIVMEGDRVLLVKRKYAPRVGEWTLPAGFVESDEDVLGGPRCRVAAVSRSLEFADAGRSTAILDPPESVVGLRLLRGGDGS